MSDTNILDTLVFSRTMADVVNGTELGHYNAADLNRVSEACNYIGELFASYGYIVPAPLKTDWQIEDIPRVSDMAVYYNTISTLCGIILYAKNPPELPGGMEKLAYIGANSIEECLQLLGKMAEAIPRTWWHCGEIESGVAYTT